MVTTKMWKSLETISNRVPRGILNFNSKFPNKLQKTTQFSHMAIPFLFFFLFTAPTLPICIIVKLLTTTSLPIHLYAIHIAMMVIFSCGIILSIVLLYTVFGNEDAFFLHFNRIATFQIKTFGKQGCFGVLKKFDISA